MTDRYYKSYIRRLIHIEGEPKTATFYRRTKTPDGYGGHTEEDQPIGEFDFTFYNQKGTQKVVQTEGTSYKGVVVTKILLLEKIEDGDEFEVDGKKYRVTFARDYLGICTQAEVERVE